MHYTLCLTPGGGKGVGVGGEPYYLYRFESIALVSLESAQVPVGGLT